MAPITRLPAAMHDPTMRTKLDPSHAAPQPGGRSQRFKPLQLNFNPDHGILLAMETIKARFAFATLNDDQIAELAKKLTERGFVISSCSPHGINFEGNRMQFERHFGSQITGDAGSYKFIKNPIIPNDLTAPDASIYLPQRPKRFP